MTLIQAIDRARIIINEPLASARTFPDNTSGFWTDAILADFHNLAQEEIQQEIIQAHEDFFLTQTSINIINGTAEYALPADFIKLRRVEDVRQGNANPVEIQPIRFNEKGQGRSVFVNSAAQYGGGYYIRDSRIVFDLTPTYTQNSAVLLHYIKRLPDVTASTNSSELPVEHHRAIVYGIVRLALWAQQSDTNKADSEYERQMSRIKSQVENRQSQRPRTVSRSSNKNAW